jgi:gas vesicle protein
MVRNMGLFILGTVFGVSLTLVFTPLSGVELRERIGLAKETPERKIEKLKKKMDNLEKLLEKTERR